MMARGTLRQSLEIGSGNENSPEGVLGEVNRSLARQL